MYRKFFIWIGKEDFAASGTLDEFLNAPLSSCSEYTRMLLEKIPNKWRNIQK